MSENFVHHGLLRTFEQWIFTLSDEVHVLRIALAIFRVGARLLGFVHHDSNEWRSPDIARYVSTELKQHKPTMYQSLRLVEIGCKNHEE